MDYGAERLTAAGLTRQISLKCEQRVGKIVPLGVQLSQTTISIVHSVQGCNLEVCKMDWPFGPSLQIKQTNKQTKKQTNKQTNKRLGISLALCRFCHYIFTGFKMANRLRYNNESTPLSSCPIKRSQHTDTMLCTILRIKSKF